ncbi:MAG: pentapeptide repeat-containing protein [Synechococcus sp.]|nr:pentapeptide repeat-containing protein [Synechococcus sp.]
MTANAPLNLQSWAPPELFKPEQADEGPVDARGADWRAMQLKGINLSKARLCRTDLRGTDLSNCILDGADLRLARYDQHTQWPEGFDQRSCGAVGPGAKLNAAFLNNTDLRGMDLRGANLMGAYLSGADLSGAVLENVRLTGADLRFAILRGAVCRGARFGGCQLDFCDFRAADLTGAGLETAESIQGADFSGSIGLGDQRQALMSRPYKELDCWNPLTRRHTREGLEAGG